MLLPRSWRNQSPILDSSAIPVHSQNLPGPGTNQVKCCNFPPLRRRVCSARLISTDQQRFKFVVVWRAFAPDRLVFGLLRRRREEICEGRFYRSREVSRGQIEMIMQVAAASTYWSSRSGLSSSLEGGTVLVPWPRVSLKLATAPLRESPDGGPDDGLTDERKSWWSAKCGGAKLW